MIEGINLSGISSTGLTLNFGSFDEVVVGTAAHGPEWPLPGVQMQIVVKSGGNQYHGSVYADYENRALQSFNIDADQIGRSAQELPHDANQLSSYHDINADVGGRITRDKAWWYFSARQQEVAARAVNFQVKPLQTELANYTGKTTSFAPGSDFNANANTSVWWKLYEWDDSNLDGVWQPGNRRDYHSTAEAEIRPTQSTEKGFHLSGIRRIAGFANVFNLLNANPEQATSWSSGTFLQPLSIVPPRIARVGMKLDW